MKWRRIGETRPSVLLEQGRQTAGDILRRVRQSEQAAMQSLSPQEQSALLTLTRRYVLACKKAMEAPSKGDA